jgi:hypothetical protein
MSARDAQRQAVRRLAARALRDAGRHVLGELGMCHRRSSPRLWWLDRGWWLVNVEFQPSSWQVGSYLNVGLQHLWVVQDHHAFEYDDRVQINGEPFVDLAVDEPDVRAAADAIAHAARQAVQAWLARLADDHVHLRWLQAQGGIGWNGLNSAIATQLAGEPAPDSFLAAAAGLDHSIGWQRDLADDCHYLAALSNDPAQFRDVVTSRISTTRANLELAPTPNQELLPPRL